MTEHLFQRERHRLIAEVLARFDPDFLDRAGIGFGGGTRIVLELDEYRESNDIDFFCPSTASYQAVRETVGAQGLGAMLRSPLTFAREIRTTRDKVVTAIAHAGQAIKLEIIAFADWRLETIRHPLFPVPVVDRTACFAIKLAAANDRGLAPPYKDVIDLIVMRAGWGDIPVEAVREAERHYGLTEMVNNAIDHSAGRWLTLDARADGDQIALSVDDDGVGIFRKIARHLGLADQRLALLELAKGKLTTDPTRHSGEGVFFTSRVFDRFVIGSGGLLFNHADVDPHDTLRDHDREQTGTRVSMMIACNAKRTLRGVFDRYSSGPDDYAFERTVVPVRLARIGTENLVSRSQAKRLLLRVDRFRRVVLDFTGVAMIGQGFADETFRVFANAHPQIELSAINAEPDVRAMIARAGGRIDADPDIEDSHH